jgi:hypothetical protein
MSDILSEADQRFATRAAAHSADPANLRAAQRFQHGVTDLQVARIMLALERGTILYRSRLGRWLAPTGSPIGPNLSPAVMEMIRTGLLRHWIDREGDHLIPAKVHLTLDGRNSLCLFAGEDLGPMRARLARELDLADCLECMDTVANGSR